MRTKKLLDAVEDGTHAAVEYLLPYLEQAAHDSSRLANRAYQRLQPLVKDAGVRGARIAADAFDKVHPVLDDALDRVSPAVDAGMAKVEPFVTDVLHQIPISVGVARGHVQDDLLPKLADALHELAKRPLTEEARAAAAALAAQLAAEQALVPKRSGWRTFGKVVLAGALLGGVVVALRKLFADPSTGWETHTPRNTYVADPVNLATEVAEDATSLVDKAKDVASDAAAKVKDVATEAVAKVKDAAAEVADKAKDVAAEASDKVEDAVEEVVEKAREAAEAADELAEGVEEQLEKLAVETDQAEGDDASPLADSPYGEGSYVGDEPPEGYLIKGNDRSMKYHLPGSAAYERTIAEVWFASEEAAEAAGFVRAQR